ncbi:hypothetical protein LIER_24575 [Lithospermum erythrorhizon]|uniref:Uncharacterized protein n=1 Tax=Lithospermum erythrorhizon TaxID=34254 RepID=A0AAV3R3S5_LITER
MKGFYEAFPSKVESDSWRPYFFYAMGDDPRHKADANAFFSYWEGKPPMPIYFYTDPRVLKAAGLFHVVDDDPGILEVLRVSFSVPDHVPPMSWFLPVYLPLPGLISFVELLDASILTWAAHHRPRPSTTVLAVQNIQDAAPPEAQGSGLSAFPRPEVNFSPTLPSSQHRRPPSPANPVLIMAQGSVSKQHSTTVVLGLEAQGGADSTTLQTPSFAVPRDLESHPVDPSSSSTGGSLPP